MERDVRIIGAPVDYGTDRRGVDMGPSAIRYAGLADQIEAAGTHSTDAGDVPVPSAEVSDPDAAVPATGPAKFLHEIGRVCAHLESEVADTIEAGALPLVLGGDHSIAIGTLRGAARDAELGVIWFDAHGDFNTPATTPSGNVHGMSLAAALGRGAFADIEWAPAAGLAGKNVALVGTRDLDDGERDSLRDSDVTVFTMSEIDARGIAVVVEDALEVATEGTDGIQVSIDLDWLDPKEAPGVGTPVRGGATYREAHSALEIIARQVESIRLLELVEVNPILDQSNETAELATELVASALGKRVF